MTREQLEELEQYELDDMVVELKAQEAAAINNQGREAQIDFILGIA